MRLTDLNGIVMSNKITLGELISLGILMVTLAGGGYALHSEIAQVRLELGQTRLELSEKIDAKLNQVRHELGEKIDAKFDQLDTKIGKVNHRMADLQERVATLETIVRVQVPGAVTGN